MSSATIVFCDIVGFSKKSADVQLDTIQSLNAEVTHELYKYIPPTYESPQIVTIPTGDGMVIALLHNEHQKWINQLFRLVGRLMQWNMLVWTISTTLLRRSKAVNQPPLRDHTISSSSTTR
jgi:hypothetical protein